MGLELCCGNGGCVVIGVCDGYVDVFDISFLSGFLSIIV